MSQSASSRPDNATLGDTNLGSAGPGGAERGASSTAANADKVELSIRLDADLMRRMSRLTDDPSKVIEAALKQWLTGTRTDSDSLARPLPPNPPVPPKGEWND